MAPSSSSAVGDHQRRSGALGGSCSLHQTPVTILLGMLCGALASALGCASSGAGSKPSASSPAASPVPANPAAPQPVTAAQTGCSPQQRERELRATQDTVLSLVPRQVASLDTAIAPGGPLEGWRLSHGLVVLAGAGAVAIDKPDAQDPLPQLLLYEPSPASTPDDWLDFEGPDGPYTLIGWAYFTPYQPDSQPPKRPCIAPSEWLVHEAGFHMKDGGMILTPGATSEPPPPDAPVHFWHPRIWDLHMWASHDGLPLVAFANPNPRPGGVVLPPGAFLVVVDGKLVPLGNAPPAASASLR